MKARKVIDPYYGRGFSLEIGEYSMGATLGVCDKLIGFDLIATPPFDTMGINSGDESGGLLTLETNISFLWITFAISFHKWIN
jgi:hypothetical protein